MSLFACLLVFVSMVAITPKLMNEGLAKGKKSDCILGKIPVIL